MTSTIKRPTAKLLTIAALAVVAAGTALTAARAASRHDDHGRMFARHGSKMADADSNRDGAVDAAEWNALFASLDADRSGKLEEQELGRHHGFPPPEALAFMIAHHADADDDGKVTGAEWKARVEELDSNDDGALGGSELSFRRRSGETETETTLPPFAAQWDTDRDGSLEATELDALFAAADDDADGVLTFKHERHGRR